MKKRILLIGLIGISFGINSQNKIEATGNVGIGTTTPSNKLTVNGFIKAEGSDGRLMLENASVTTSVYLRNRGLTGQRKLEFLYGTSTKMVLDNNGNLGIGTTNPNEKLHIVGSSLFENNSGFGIKLNGYNGIESTGEPHWLHINRYSNDNVSFGHNSISNVYMVKGGGKVGIGTTNPNSKLEIVDNTSNIGNYSDGSLQIAGSNNVIGFVGQSNLNPSFNRWGIKLRETKDGDFSIHSYSTNTTRFIINSFGDIGIGTINPDAKLAVNGKIHTKEVKVDLIGWSDFVFESEYKLPTLRDVEKHIKEKGHLKDIPSAKEVAKNGIYLGKMNSKLLQKIEELTLYTIAQEKKIEKVKKANESLATKFLELRKRLDKLEMK